MSLGKPDWLHNRLHTVALPITPCGVRLSDEAIGFVVGLIRLALIYVNLAPVRVPYKCRQICRNSLVIICILENKFDI